MQQLHGSRGATWLGAAQVRGRLYRIDWYPALVADAGAESWVEGDLYRMQEPVTLLPLLDAYEEVGPEFPMPQEYRRVALPVRTAAGDVTAWGYVYVLPSRDLPLIASGDFLSA